MRARLIGRTGPTAGQDFILLDVATIGASADNNIRIAAAGVSRRHARIVADNGRYFLEDAGATNGTFLNGACVLRELLQHLDVITLGRDVDLIFIKRDGDTPAPIADGVTSARLQIVDGPDAGTMIDVPKGELTLGRALSCNVVLANGVVSKVHARVRRAANQVVLQDLHSVNGTFVNGVRVDSVVVLNDGDTINVAGVRNVSVRIEGVPWAASGGLSAAIAEEPAFDQEWRTRFVWAPDELALIEAARAEAMQLAALRAPGSSSHAADKKPAAAPVKSAPPKMEPSDMVGPPAAPNPSARVAPKADSAQPKANVLGPRKQAPPSATIPEPAIPSAPVPVTPDPASSPKAEIAMTTMAGSAMDVDGGEVTRSISVAKAQRLCGIRLVGAGTPIALGIGTFVVGRAIESDVRIDDRQVSRSHARITVDERSAMIEDLHTANGTLLNGKEVRSRQPLNAGDILQVGASAFTVMLMTN